MRVCPTCHQAMLIGPGGCACTQAAQWREITDAMRPPEARGRLTCQHPSPDGGACGRPLIDGRCDFAARPPALAERVEAACAELDDALGELGARAVSTPLHSHAQRVSRASERISDLAREATKGGREPWPSR